jgi:hypothetical protein
MESELLERLRDSKKILRWLDKGKVVLLNYAPRLEDMWGSGGITPHILNLDARYRIVVSFTPWPLSLLEELENRRPGGPQNRSGRCGENKNLLSLPRSETHFLGRVATVPIELSRFLH